MCSFCARFKPVCLFGIRMMEKRRAPMQIKVHNNDFVIWFVVPAHFTTKNKQISVAKGKQVHVQCNVQGDTPIDIKWKVQNTHQHIDSSTDTRYIEQAHLIALETICKYLQYKLGIRYVSKSWMMEWSLNLAFLIHSATTPALTFAKRATLMDR